ncbi:MAG: efflux RND transporter permease subunit, partial [Prevotella sp.]|nr:efflux RND transporter permease subunit [Prevotella sp.]
MLRTILHRPIAVTMTLIAIVTLGVLALGRIPVSLMPDIDVPRIVVQMSAQGSSAREIEQRMVGPMRRQLSQVAGLKDIESTSRTDAGLITLTFSPGSDMSLLFIEVNEKIDRAMSFMPKEMERPKVMKIGALDIPAFYVDVTGGKPEQTSRLVSNVISKRLEQLPEVAMVDYSGLTGTQITIR